MKKIILPSMLMIASIVLLSFSKQAATTYKVDAKTSKITWTATKVTGSHTGNVNFATGSFVFDGTNLSAGKFDVDMTSITVTDLNEKTGKGKLEGHLNSDDFFSTAKHKTASFQVTKAKKVEGERFDVTGNLTIKGITNEVSFPATIKVTGESVITVGTIKVDRTKFDIKYGSGSFFENLGDKAINDNFELQLSVIARK
jgi:polyisoprenoid-binding protein YceI